jgi:NAD(P)-dependent dehydrogenase (short-subunit alcohol dehydrogenase family)
VKPFGINITLIEPAAFDTDWAGSSSKRSAENPAYDDFRKVAAEQRAKRAGNPGSAAATREAILRIVDAEIPPLRVFLGRAPLGIATADYESRLATWREWQPVSEAAQG